MDEDDIQANKIQLQKQEEVKKIISNHDSSNKCMDLANRSIHYIPKNLLLITYIEHLYLEGNFLQELPKYFFESLPKLKWLDLRNNNLEYLPSSIGKHRNLKNLLLEKNQITRLPLELGFVRTITGLSLRGNPLEMPPSHIVEQGAQEILSYLREESHNFKNSAVVNGEEELLSDDDSNYLYDEEDEDRLSIPSPMNNDLDYEFNPLRHGPTPVPAKFHDPRISKRHKDSRNAAYMKPTHINLLNTSNLSEMTRSKEWLGQMQQRKKNVMVLDEWREEARKLQKILIPRSKTDIGRTTKPPYGVDIPPSEARPVTKEERRIHTDSVEEKVDRVEPKNIKTKERIDSEVQARIRLHTSQLQTRRKKNSDEPFLQPGRELQRELLNEKMAHDPRLEYRFRAFTGDSSSLTSSNKTSSL